MNDPLSKAFSPATLGKLQLQNRILKAATYEGKTPDGVPGELLLNFHKGIVQGGTAMTTIGSCTTEADGRINDAMMWMHERYSRSAEPYEQRAEERRTRGENLRPDDALRLLLQEP